MEDSEVADLLGCVGADLIDVARRVGELLPGLQAAAAELELNSITTAEDPLSQRVAWLLSLIAGAVRDSSQD